MLTETLSFDVVGKPITQGSMVNFGAGRPLVHSNAKALLAWRNNIAHEARVARAGCELVDGPCHVTAQFVVERPKGHFRAGKNAHILRDDAPNHPTKRSSGDIDKLVRAVLDALTAGGVWTDDSQVISVHTSKRYPILTDAADLAHGVRIVINFL